MPVCDHQIHNLYYSGPIWSLGFHKRWPSWQHQDKLSPILIPSNGVLPKLWEETIKLGKDADAVINFGYDWLPLWLTNIVDIKLFHLISMGAESIAMQNIIREISQLFPSRLAFHTKSQ